MMRQISYRTAINAFAFTGLWFAIGGITLWSPIPGALGIAAPMFTAWLLLLFAMLALAGGMLTVAALNAAFPLEEKRQRPPAWTKQPRPVRSDSAQTPIWAPPARPAAPARPPAKASSESRGRTTGGRES